MTSNDWEDKNKRFLHKRVKIQWTHKEKYGYKTLVGKTGTVERISGSTIGVRIDNNTNNASQYGLYWFKDTHLKILENSMEDENMKDNAKLEGYKWIADVEVWDFNNKIYSYALYDEDLKHIEEVSVFDDEKVTVLVKDKNEAIFVGYLKNIVSVENHDKNVKITAQVMGVVDMRRYLKDKHEAKRKAEMKKRADSIKKELDEAWERQKNMEFYKQFAKDNPDYADMVKELEQLEEGM